MIAKIRIALLIPVCCLLTACSIYQVMTKPTPVRFEFDNNLGMITDKQTGLQWRRCAIGRSWDTNSKQCTGDAKTATWTEMVALASKESYAGFNDWRLPTDKEYQALVYAESITGKCQELQGIVKKLFPNVFSRYLFGSNHWLADNTSDSMNPVSADLEVVIGFSCRITEKSVRPHGKQPAIVVRGGVAPQEWILALSKTGMAREVNKKSEAESKKYWGGVNKKLNDLFTAPSPATNTDATSHCVSSSDTCFRAVSRRGKNEVVIECTKGNRTGQTSYIRGPDEKGKWAAGFFGGYYYDYRRAGNFECGY